MSLIVQHREPYDFVTLLEEAVARPDFCRVLGVRPTIKKKLNCFRTIVVGLDQRV